MAAPAYIELAIEAALKDSPDVAAICAGRVYPLEIPQGTKLPAVVYQRIYTSPDMTLRGYTSEGVTIMVNSFALKFGEAKALALAVRKTMAAKPLNAIFQDENDLNKPDSGARCVSAEYLVQQPGGYCYGSEL